MTINGSKKEMVYYDSLGGEGCDYYETYRRVILDMAMNYRLDYKGHSFKSINLGLWDQWMPRYACIVCL